MPFHSLLHTLLAKLLILLSIRYKISIRPNKIKHVKGHDRSFFHSIPLAGCLLTCAEQNDSFSFQTAVKSYLTRINEPEFSSYLVSLYIEEKKSKIKRKHSTSSHGRVQVLL